MTRGTRGRVDYDAIAARYDARYRVNAMAGVDAALRASGSSSSLPT
jgi:hypothetical protein